MYAAANAGARYGCDVGHGGWVLAAGLALLRGPHQSFRPFLNTTSSLLRPVYVVTVQGYQARDLHRLCQVRRQYTRVYHLIRIDSSSFVFASETAYLSRDNVVCVQVSPGQCLVRRRHSRSCSQLFPVRLAPVTSFVRFHGRNLGTNQIRQACAAR